MEIIKEEKYSKSQNIISKYAKALSHPARIAILEILLKNESCICGDIVEQVPLSQSTVSQHLKELKNAGLIKGEIEGVKVCYCINEKEWEKAKNYFNDFFINYNSKNNCC